MTLNSLLLFHGDRLLLRLRGSIYCKVKTLIQGIIIINESFAKQINLAKRKTNQQLEGSELKPYNVPFPFREIKENKFYAYN